MSKSITTKDGKQYASFGEAARAYGLTSTCVTQRLKRGWTIEQAVGIESRRKVIHKNLIEFEGKEYPNREELARSFGVTASNVHSRLNLGWTMRQALEVDPAPKRRSWARNSHR